MSGDFKKIITVLCILTTAVIFPLRKDCASGAALGSTLELSAEVLEDKGQDTQWVLMWFSIKKSWEAAAEWIGVKDKELMSGLTHQPIDKVHSVWEADMKNFLKAIETTMQVSKAIEKVGGGDYGEATLHTLYAGAELLGNPIVKLMCAAGLYTAESYKQLQETGAALKVEALYGALDTDRRVLGTPNPQSDTPALIPLDDETVNYIYQKYIWDSDDSRRLVVAYFNAKGTGWPAEEWAQLYNAFSRDAFTADPKRKAELEALNNNFRTKAIPWVRILIKDVNAQAKFRWSEMRLQQVENAFQEYLRKGSQVKEAFANIEHQLKLLEGAKNQVPEWQKLLNESPATREKVTKLLQDPKKLRDAQTLAESWLSKIRTATGGAKAVGETKLFDALHAERRAWYEIENSLGNAISKQKETVVKDPISTYDTPPTEDLTDEMKSYKQNFEPLMVPFDDWAIRPDEVVAGVLAALNVGNITEAVELQGKWQQELPKIDAYHFSDDGLRKKLDEQKKAAEEGPTNRLGELAATQRKLEEQLSAVNTKLRGIGAGRTVELDQLEANLKSQKRGIEDQINSLQPEIKKLNEELSNLQKAHEIAWKVNESLREMSNVEHQETRKKIENAIGIVSRLQEARTRQWQAYRGVLIGFESELPIKTVTGNDIEFSRDIDGQVGEATAKIDEALAKAKENSYTTVGSFEEAGSLGELLKNMADRAGNIKWGAPQFEEMDRLTADMERWFTQWQMAADRWENTERLSPEDENEMRVLVVDDGGGSIEALSERITAIERTIDGITDLTSKLKGKVGEYLSFNDSEVRDRQKDSEWLESKIIEIRSFLKAQEDLKKLKNKGSDYAPDYEGVFETVLDMGVTNTPYRHYMLASDVEAYAQDVESGWARYPGFQFIKTYAPRVYQKLKAAARPTGIKLASEENVIARTGANADMTLWKSTLDKFETAADSVKYDASDLQFMQQMLAVTTVEGMANAITSAASGKKVPYAVSDVHKNYASNYDNPLGKRFIAILDKLQKTFDDREEYLKTTETTGPGGGKPGEPAGPGGRPSGPGPGTGSPSGTPDSPQGPGKGSGGPGGGADGPGGGSPQGPGGKPQDDPGTWKGGPSGGYIKTKSSLAVYQLYDARLNTKSLQSAYGDVVLMNTDLRQGMVEITGRLGSMENVDKLLISLDDGRTWKELPLQENISYQFSPMAGMDYQIVLKVKTKSLEEHKIQFFETVRAIRYENINYTNLVQEAVQALADAYERQDISSVSTLIARDYIGNRVFLEEGVRFDFDMFTDIRLRIFIDRIENRGKLYVAETHWEKSQVPRKTGQQQKTTGKTVMSFVLEEGKLRIQNLRGNVIYATLSPEIAEASGLPQTTVEEIRTAHDDRNPTQPGAGETTDSGGTTSSSTIPTQNATVTSAPPPGGPNIQGLNFATGTVTTGAGNGDFDFENGNMFVMNGAARIQQAASSFDSLTVAPTSGYAAFSGVAAGNVYVFITQGGFYGKLEITSIVNNPPVNDTVTFKYAVQTDGSTNIST